MQCSFLNYPSLHGPHYLRWTSLCPLLFTPGTDLSISAHTSQLHDVTTVVVDLSLCDDVGGEVTATVTAVYHEESLLPRTLKYNSEETR